MQSAQTPRARHTHGHRHAHANPQPSRLSGRGPPRWFPPPPPMVSSLRSWGVEVTRRLGPTGPPNFSGPLLRPPPHPAPFPSTKPFSYKTVSRLRHSNLASCTRLPVHTSGLQGRHGEPAGARGGHGVQLLPSACYSPRGDTELATDRSSAMLPRPPGSPSSPGPRAGLRPASQPASRSSVPCPPLPTASASEPP